MGIMTHLEVGIFSSLELSQAADVAASTAAREL